LAYDAATLLLDCIEQTIQQAGHATRAGVIEQLAEKKASLADSDVILYCYEQGHNTYPGRVTDQNTVHRK
jgi:hypothetical protein